MVQALPEDWISRGNSTSDFPGQRDAAMLLNDFSTNSLVDVVDTNYVATSFPFWTLFEHTLLARLYSWNGVVLIATIKSVLNSHWHWLTKSLNFCDFNQRSPSQWPQSFNTNSSLIFSRFSCPCLPRKCSPSTKSDHNAKALFGGFICFTRTRQMCTIYIDLGVVLYRSTLLWQTMRDQGYCSMPSEVWTEFVCMHRCELAGALNWTYVFDRVLRNRACVTHAYQLRAKLGIWWCRIVSHGVSKTEQLSAFRQQMAWRLSHKCQQTPHGGRLFCGAVQGMVSWGVRAGSHWVLFCHKWVALHWDQIQSMKKSQLQNKGWKDKLF